MDKEKPAYMACLREVVNTPSTGAKPYRAKLACRRSIDKGTCIAYHPMSNESVLAYRLLCGLGISALSTSP